MPESTRWQEQAQWFRAALPALARGRSLDYRLELTRAGRQLAVLPPDGSWLTVTGDPSTSPGSADRSAAQSQAMASRNGLPRWAYELTFFGALTLNFRPEIIGETPEGYRINFRVESGHVVGPRIEAVVRPEGGDWMCIRRDGIGLLDVRTTYETTDGALILEKAGGLLDTGPSGYARLAAGQFTGCPPVCATLRWSTAHPAWSWLNRCQGIGMGRAVMDKLEVHVDVYIPRVLDQLNDD